MKRRHFLHSNAAFAGALSLPLAARAQSRPKDVLIVANETGPNSLDIHTVGANRPSYGVSWLVYDRLMTFGTKKLPDGTVTYDYTKLEPELAESWLLSGTGDSIIFRLRRDAKFHDGTPVTARDVKWSFDRAVTVGGFPTFQMKAGSLEKPEQFTAVDDHTFRIDFLRKDKLTLMDLAVPVPSIFNSELVKKNATPQDPWGLNWTRTNTAGGGAFKIEAFRPGQEIVYVRNEDWKSGKLPQLRRVIQREVPSAGNRRALLSKGDIDMTFEMPPKDFAEMAREGGAVRVVSMPIENSIWYLGMNVTKPPFDNPKVRQAVAYAVPYEAIMSNAMYGRATKMWGAKGKATTAAWPQPAPYATDPARAKKLLAEAGYANGFETTLSFDHGVRAGGDPDPGVARQARHQGADQQGAGGQLARRAAEEGHAADHQPLWRLVELPRVLLLLVLPRPERGVQHDELSEPGDGQADRRRALRDQSQEVRGGREGVHRHGLCRGAAHPAGATELRRGDAEERAGLRVLVPPAAGLSDDFQDVRTTGDRAAAADCRGGGLPSPGRCAATLPRRGRVESPSPPGRGVGVREDRCPRSPSAYGTAN